LTYRLIVIYHQHRQGLGELQQNLLSQWRAALDWPAAQLMVLALALVAHFDAVVSAWRDWHAARGEGWWVLDLGYLDAAARASVRADLVEAAEEGELQDIAPALRELRDAMSLVWRVLVGMALRAGLVRAGRVRELRLRPGRRATRGRRSQVLRR
jgi:AmpE protein